MRVQLYYRGFDKQSNEHRALSEKQKENNLFLIKYSLASFYITRTNIRIYY